MQRTSEATGKLAALAKAQRRSENPESVLKAVCVDGIRLRRTEIDA